MRRKPLLKGWMGKSIFFISDAHLGFAEETVEKEREAKLMRFLNHAGRTGSAIFIVGDLFDFWYEYNAVIPRRYFSIIKKLRDLTESGIRVVYLAGNHDFGIGAFVRDDLKAETAMDGVDEVLDGKRFHVEHGDGIAKADSGYRLLKRVVRSRWNQSLFRSIHPDVGFALARFFSRLSRNHREPRDQDAEYIEYARKRFAEGFDCVVLGHTHRPQYYKENGSVYVNTGDWMDSFTYGKLEAGVLSLERWSDQTES